VDDIRTGGYSPTIRKRSLSRKLVELRKNCGLTTTQVQLQLNWSASKLNYIEKAQWIGPDSDAVADPCCRVHCRPALSALMRQPTGRFPRLQPARVRERERARDDRGHKDDHEDHQR